MEVQNLKAYLANVGMTMQQLSEKVECNTRYLTRLATGELTPSKRLARDIYQATGGVVKLKTKRDYANDSKTDHNDSQNNG